MQLHYLLADNSDRSRKTAKGKNKNRALDEEKRKKREEREKKLIDAAFYVGSTSENNQEYDLALRYLRYMAEENESTLDKKYAQEKLKELNKL